LKLESVAIANALQLKGRQTARQSIWAVLAKYVRRMLTNCSCELPIKILKSPLDSAPPIFNSMLSYRRETALQGAL